MKHEVRQNLIVAGLIFVGIWALSTAVSSAIHDSGTTDNLVHSSMPIKPVAVDH